MLSNASMTSQGSIDLIIKPDGPDSSYNPFTAILPSIRQFDEGDIPHIQLNQFCCFNNFYNISAGLQNNILKIVTVIGTSGLNYVQQITVPDGTYTIKTLLAYLNGTGTSNVSAQWVFPTTNTNSGLIYTSAIDVNENYYQAVYTGGGFDPTLTARVAPNNVISTKVLTPLLDPTNPLVTTTILPFSVDANNIVTFNTPPKNIYFKDYTGIYSVNSDPYIVNTIGLVEDDQTVGLLTLMGFKAASTQKASIPYCNLYGYYVHMIEDATETTTIDYNNNIVGVRNYNLGGIEMLFFGLSNVQNENYSNDPTLNNLNVIATMPFQASFGDMFVYEPPNAQPIGISNINVEHLECIILDQDLRRVNFQGLKWHATIRLTFTSNAQYLQSELNQGFNSMVLPDRAKMPESIRHNANLPARNGSGRKRSRLLEGTSFQRYHT